MVGERRVELLRLSALVPKTSVSAIPPLARVGTAQPPYRKHPNYSTEGTTCQGIHARNRWNAALNRGELRKVRESRQLHGHLPIPGRVRCFRKCRGRNTRMSAQNRGQNDPGLRCLRTHDPDRNSTANSQDDLADHTVCRPAARFPIAGSQSCAQMSQALGKSTSCR